MCDVCIAQWMEMVNRFRCSACLSRFSNCVVESHTHSLTHSGKHKNALLFFLFPIFFHCVINSRSLAHCINREKGEIKLTDLSFFKFFSNKTHFKTEQHRRFFSNAHRQPERELERCDVFQIENWFGFINLYMSFCFFDFFFGFLL